MYVCMYIYVIIYFISVRNNIVQMSSNFYEKIAIQSVNWVAICNT